MSASLTSWPSPLKVRWMPLASQRMSGVVVEWGACSWLIISFLLLNYRLRNIWSLADHCLSFPSHCSLPPTSEVKLLLKNGVASQGPGVPNDIPNQQPCSWFLYGQWTMHYKTYVHPFGRVCLSSGVTSFLQPSSWLPLQSASSIKALRFYG